MAGLIVCLAGACTSVSGAEDVWSRPPRCTAEGELGLSLGHGETDFTALDRDKLPPVFEGGQGGHHFFLALRLEGGDFSLYDSVAARFEAVYQINDGACAGGAIGTAAAECLLSMGRRDVVLKSGEEAGLLLEVDSVPAGNWTLGAMVRDPCGRTATTQHKALHLSE